MKTRLEKIASVVVRRAAGESVKSISLALRCSPQQVRRYEATARTMEERASEWAAMKELIHAVREKYRPSSGAGDLTDYETPS